MNEYGTLAVLFGAVFWLAMRAQPPIRGWEWALIVLLLIFGMRCVLLALFGGKS